MALPRVRKMLCQFLVVNLADEHLQALWSGTWLDPTSRFAEWRPSPVAWQFGSRWRAAIGELSVKQHDAPRELRHFHSAEGFKKRR